MQPRVWAARPAIKPRTGGGDAVQRESDASTARAARLSTQCPCCKVTADCSFPGFTLKQTLWDKKGEVTTNLDHTAALPGTYLEKLNSTAKRTNERNRTLSPCEVRGLTERVYTDESPSGGRAGGPSPTHKRGRESKACTYSRRARFPADTLLNPWSPYSSALRTPSDFAVRTLINTIYLKAVGVTQLTFSGAGGDFGGFRPLPLPVSSVEVMLLPAQVMPCWGPLVPESTRHMGLGLSGAGGGF